MPPGDCDHMTEAKSKEVLAIEELKEMLDQTQNLGTLEAFWMQFQEQLTFENEIQRSKTMATFFAGVAAHHTLTEKAMRLAAEGRGDEAGKAWAKLDKELRDYCASKLVSIVSEAITEKLGEKLSALSQKLPVEFGERVGVILCARNNVIEFIGYGVLEGVEVPDTPGRIFDELREIKREVPKIRLDNGEVVWGCECYWNSEEKTKKHLENYDTIIHVDMTEHRRQQDIVYKMDLEAVVKQVEDNNPGARSVIQMLMTQSDSAWLLHLLQKAELTGPVLWVAFKDVCGQDAENLAKEIRSDAAGLKVAALATRLPTAEA